MHATTLTKRFSLLAAGIILLLAIFLQAMNVHAATLNNAFVRFDRMKISTATTGTVCARPTTVGSTEVDVQVTFPTGYTTSTTAGNWTVNTTATGWPTAVAPITAVSAWPGIGTATAAVGASGGTVTFPSTDLTSATTLYCFNWINTAAVSVASGAASNLTGTIATRAAGAAAIDSTTYSTAAIADDQIVVTATVPQTFSFALSGNSDTLGALNTSTVVSSPTPRTATVNTNAKNGWYVWARDSNAGLTSTAAGATISSTAGNNTLSGGTPGYNMGVTQAQGGGTGAITVATTFVGGASRGGGLSTSLATIAQSNGTAQAAVLTLTNNAAIDSTIAAASDYTDTITVVGAGLF